MTRIATRRQPEAHIKRAVRQALSIKGWFIFPVMQGFGSYNGISDFIAVRKGRVVFIEIKTPSGKQSDFQKRFEADIQTAGGEYRIIRTIEEAIAL